MRQEGHVTTRQVEAAGLTRPALHYQVTSGLLAYTAPARTFLDLLAASFPLEPLRDAYRHALDRGLLRARALTEDAARVHTYLAKAPGRSRALRERLAQLVEAN